MLTRVLTLGALVAAVAAGHGAAAQQPRTPIDVSTLGPQVGEAVPDFRLVDQNGRTQTRQSILGSRGAMLVFIRSADW